MILRMAILMALGGLLLACSKPAPVVHEEAHEEVREEVQVKIHGIPHPHLGEPSLEARIAVADVIARVRLESVSSGVTEAYFYEDHPDHTNYVGHLDFRFRVLEYLKGSGPNEITAVVVATGPPLQPRFSSRQEMEDALPGLLADRDTRWDDRDAVVFLKSNYRDGSHAFLPYVRQAGRYYLGKYVMNYPGDDGYTVSSRWNKAWLPAVTSTGQGDSATEFLTDAPPEGSTGGTTGPTITKSALEEKVTQVSNRLAENGGSEDQVKCILNTFFLESFEAEYGFESVEPHPIDISPIQSGQAAGTRVWSDQNGLLYKTWRERLWLDAAGEAILEVQTGESPPLDIDYDGDGTNEAANYERRLHLARPLPAGTHSFRLKSQGGGSVVCDGFVHNYPLELVVNAPAGVVAESFFDPTVRGSAIGETTTLGPIKWEAGQIEATLSRDITGHVLDFISLDGTVEVLLKAADATRNGGTWTWTMPSQPWDDEDKLMVRLYGVTTTTCAGEPVPFAACVLTFSPASYAFSVSEDASVGHAVGAISAISPTAGATVMYSLTAGNADGKFALDTTTGQITVAAALDSATSYTLKVEASDGSGETATATVAVTVAS